MLLFNVRQVNEAFNCADEVYILLVIYTGWDQKKDPPQKINFSASIGRTAHNFLHVLTYIDEMIPVDFCNAICIFVVLGIF